MSENSCISTSRRTRAGWHAGSESHSSCLLNIKAAIAFYNHVAPGQAGTLNLEPISLGINIPSSFKYRSIGIIYLSSHSQKNCTIKFDLRWSKEFVSINIRAIPVFRGLVLLIVSAPVNKYLAQKIFWPHVKYALMSMYCFRKFSFQILFERLFC